MLSDRQSQLISAIIQEHIKNAEPVGSSCITIKYNLDVSAATIRNEMAVLVEEGFLDKPHFSAGRVPTALAFRHFVNHLMQEESLPVVDEVSIKQRLWEKRQDPVHFLQQAVYDLARATQGLGLVYLNNEEFYFSGMASLLDHSEFYNIDLTRTVLRLLDEPEMLGIIFQQISAERNGGILLGHELGMESLSPCGLVFARIQPTRGKQGFLSVLGPMRMDYSHVIPRVKYFQKLVNELMTG
ncbi:hypothetical protein KKB83_03505 [Patescibacteria group bacterium]|nr:hypothetical protein [Patescibacteria group bacterium]